MSTGIGELTKNDTSGAVGRRRWLVLLVLCLRRGSGFTAAAAVLAAIAFRGTTAAHLPDTTVSESASRETSPRHPQNADDLTGW